MPASGIMNNNADGILDAVVPKEFVGGTVGAAARGAAVLLEQEPALSPSPPRPPPPVVAPVVAPPVAPPTTVQPSAKFKKLIAKKKFQKLINKVDAKNKAKKAAAAANITQPTAKFQKLIKQAAEKQKAKKKAKEAARDRKALKKVQHALKKKAAKKARQIAAIKSNHTKIERKYPAFRKIVAKQKVFYCFGWFRDTINGPHVRIDDRICGSARRGACNGHVTDVAHTVLCGPSNKVVFPSTVVCRVVDSSSCSW